VTGARAAPEPQADRRGPECEHETQRYRGKHAEDEPPLQPSERARLRWSEAVLAALTEAGLTGQRRVIALRCLVAYVTGALQAQYLGPLAGPGTTMLAALSPATYPLLAETAKYTRDVPPEQEFGQGFDIVLQGLRAKTDQRLRLGAQNDLSRADPACRTV
jgi:hypothetical protein